MPQTILATTMKEMWKIRVYENGRHVPVSKYDTWELSALAGPVISLLERKDITMRIDSDEKDIALEYPVPLPSALAGNLVRIYPANTDKKRWAEHVHVHFINPTLFAKHYQQVKTTQK